MERIVCGRPDFGIELQVSPEAPPRIVRIGPPDAEALAPGQCAVEIVTVDSGHDPTTTRLTAGACSRALRFVAHRRDRDAAGWTHDVVHLEERAAGRAAADSLHAELHLAVAPAGSAARCWVVVANPPGARSTRQLRSVTSLAVRVGDADVLRHAAATSSWIGESRWSVTPLRAAGLADLGLRERAVRSRGTVARRSTGSWSTGTALPVGAVLGPSGALAWQIEHNGAWRADLAEDPEGVSLALSGPTDDDHGWLRALAPGETFTTVPVSIATGADLDDAFGELTTHRRRSRTTTRPAGGLPVVYNDFMNTLVGNPSTDRLLPLIDAAARVGAEVFVIDAGWYAEDGDWWTTVGDWHPSESRFPGGLRLVLDRIRDHGMIPGLWLEPEAIGLRSDAAATLPDDAVFQRGGERVVDSGRYHLDLRHPAARRHLDDTVDRLVRDLGIGYLKLDYNIDPGAGTDTGGAPAGVGLLGHNRAHLDWLESIHRRHPGLLLENCASGGMRMDHALVSRTDLQSTSDQEDAERYAPIAASGPLTMAPEQAANWAYPAAAMSLEQTAFTLCTGLAGHLYLSGHLDRLDESQTALVQEAVAVSRRIRHEIRDSTPRWPLGIDQWEAGWCVLALAAPEAHLVTVWRRPGAPSTVELPLPDLRGLDIQVEVLFPTDLDPWSTAWDRGAGSLRLGTVGSTPAARTFRLTTIGATRP